MNGVVNENLRRMKNNQNHDYSSNLRRVEGAFEWRVSSRGDMDMSSAD